VETPWTEVAVRLPAVARRFGVKSRERLLIPAVFAAVAVLIAPACSTQPEPARANDVIGWTALGSWSGRGSTQTGSFMVEGSLVRVRWQTGNDAPTGSGNFRLTLHSAVSGRQLAVVTDHRGAGQGEIYIPEEPRPSYMFVESEDLDWSFTVEEGQPGTAISGGAGSPRD
jgi:hypothetical protein